MPKLPKPTPAELDLLRVLWRLGPSTVKEVHLEAAKAREIAYANVLRQLQIMHDKGLVSRNESQRSHVYAPVQAKEVTRKGLLTDFIRMAFSGSGKELVMAALQGGHITPEERAEIEAFLRGEAER